MEKDQHSNTVMRDIDALRWMLGGNIRKFKHELKMWFIISENVAHLGNDFCEQVKFIEFVRLMNNMFASMYVVLQECNRTLRLILDRQTIKGNHCDKHHAS